MTPEYAGTLCDALDKSLRGSEHNLTAVANTIVVVLRDEAWKRRRIRTGEIVECESFLELLTAPPLKGFGEDPQKVEALIKDDTEALRLFREAVKGPGRRNDLHNNIREVKPRFQGTSRAYTLARLKRERPDLYDQVVAKQLSAHAAAIQAGIITPKTPLEQLRHWWAKASPDDQSVFLREREEAWASAHSGGGSTAGVNRQRS